MSVQSAAAEPDFTSWENPVMTEWLPIRYREFYDFPRMVVVEYQGDLFLLDSQFDHSTDDYSDDFVVYRLPDSAVSTVESSSWEGLASTGAPLGRIPTTRVTFDPTKRHAIAAAVFERIKI